MAKTGEIAAFALGEKKTAMVNLPAQFVTSSTADMKGQKYSDLVDYADNSEKTSDLNNESITDLIDLKEQFSKRGYANRNSAVTEPHPIFGNDKLNYDNHDISVL
ncbi:MAG: IS110 family transposase, partial [Leuconostoc sp.]|nr:IS110 family transposase [Leuconostoc sp.]